MNATAHTEGVMAMLVERFESQHLARLLDLKSAVDSGQLLDDHDSSFLESIFHEAMHSKHLVDRHPEYQPLYARVIQLYKAIAAQALTNEMRASPRPEPSSRLH